MCLLQSCQHSQSIARSLHENVTNDKQFVVPASNCLWVQFSLVHENDSLHWCLTIHSCCLHWRRATPTTSHPLLTTRPSCWVWPAVVSVSCWPISDLQRPRQTTYAKYKINGKKRWVAAVICIHRWSVKNNVRPIIFVGCVCETAYLVVLNTVVFLIVSVLCQ